MASEVLEHRPADLPSPGVDVHAVLGLPRPKRPSEQSDHAEEAAAAAAADDEGSDTDDVIDSDDDTEEWQEGEYLVMDGSEDEERKELQTEMLSENASRSRDSLVPVFITCCAGYDKWIRENTTTVPEEEMVQRRQQLELYKQVLEFYGSDVEWEKLTHAQRVNRNKLAHEASIEAKKLGPPPETVTEASVPVDVHEN